MLGLSSAPTGMKQKELSFLHLTKLYV